MTWDFMTLRGGAVIARLEDPANLHGPPYVLVPLQPGYKFVCAGPIRLLAIAALTYKGPKPVGVNV
jgi:hypothetical protein